MENGPTLKNKATNSEPKDLNRQAVASQAQGMSEIFSSFLNTKKTILVFVFGVRVRKFSVVHSSVKQSWSSKISLSTRRAKKICEIPTNFGQAKIATKIAKCWQSFFGTL